MRSSTRSNERSGAAMRYSSGALTHEWVRCVVGWLVKLRDSDSY
ncbi:hypothetical protein EV283_1040 [Sphingomonas sp. BK036]|nr:hypothetical protein EV283_1040 [Sphingomonas sp. BK036]